MRLLLKNCSLIEGLKNILIDGKKIAYIGYGFPDSDKQIDIQGNVVIPGIIDSHTHIRDLSLSYKEDWASASRAAVTNGITTVLDMPNTIPPTTNLYNLNLKRKQAKKSLVNYRFFLGATKSNIFEIDRILKANPNDVVGIKVFMSASNSNDIVQNKEVLRRIFSVAKFHNKPIVVHSELQECIDKWRTKIQYNSPIYHNQIRNRECAIKGTELVLKIVSEVWNTLYIAHISTAEEIDMIRKYKESNQVYCEVTPHHLLLNEKIIKKIGNIGKVNPPLRTEQDNKALWDAVLDGTIDTIASDHAPHLLQEKQRHYNEAPSGFPGLETMPHLLINEVNKGNLTLKKLISLMSENPAKIFNIENRGEIQEGYYADIVAVDMQKKWTIDSSRFYSKAHFSPFDRWNVQGKVFLTIVNGKVKFYRTL
ncbi:MAG: dihydroorotase [Candidatus Cloacimonadota bacterium]|nr:MAG: dihydroorotase [Candidatus Cloacimonadota bacterium]